MNLLRGPLKIESKRLKDLDALEHRAKAGIPRDRPRLAKIAAVLRCIANGSNAREVKESLKVSESYVRFWVNRFNSEGIHGVLKRRMGRPQKVTGEEWRQIGDVHRRNPEAIRGTKKTTNSSDIAAYILRAYGKNISARTVRDNRAQFEQ